MKYIVFSLGIVGGLYGLFKHDYDLILYGIFAIVTSIAFVVVFDER